MAHQYSRVGFNSSVEVNEVNLSLSYGGVVQTQTRVFPGLFLETLSRTSSAKDLSHKSVSTRQ